MFLAVLLLLNFGCVTHLYNKTLSAFLLFWSMCPPTGGRMRMLSCDEQLKSNRVQFVPWLKYDRRSKVDVGKS